MVSGIRPKYLCALVFLGVAAIGATGCSTSKPKLGPAAQSGTYAENGPTSGPEYFSAAAYGVAASPRVAAGPRLPRGGGSDKIGKPYTVAGKTYRPTATPNKVEHGRASWYGAAFHGRKTANGEVYDMNHLTAAHKTMPLPSYARVTNTANGRSVIVRVNDRGPFAHDRVIDLSKRAAELLDYTRAGTAKVKVEYAGRAPLHGRDDDFLLASVRGVPAGPAPGVMMAMNGATPNGGPVPRQALPGVNTDGLTTGGTVLAVSTSGGRPVILPARIPLPGERPNLTGAGVAISAYADMRVTGAFASSPAGGTRANWKTR